MKVLQINAVNGIRSTGRITLETAKFLELNNHDAYIAFSEGEKYDKGYLIGNRTEKKIHGFLSRLTGLQGYFSVISTLKFLKYIKKIDPDIVQIGNLHSNYINMPLLFKYLADNDVPTIIVLHDCWFYTGGHTHYLLDKYEAWKDGFSEYKKDKNTLGNKSWHFDQSEKIFNDQLNWFQSIPRLAFVGVSKWITDEANKSKITKNSIVKKIYNWVDISVFKPLDFEVQCKTLDDKFVILGVASQWSTSKGLDEFIRISKTISNDMIIMLVGKIDNKVVLPNNIIHVQETHDVKSLVEYYNIADVFLNLSLEESFGKVTVEALACGTPVIVTDSTANPELVGNGCGYVVENNKSLEITDYIKKIQANGKQYYSDDCIRFVQSNFKKDDKLNEYLDLYKKMVSM